MPGSRSSKIFGSANVVDWKIRLDTAAVTNTISEMRFSMRDRLRRQLAAAAAWPPALRPLRGALISGQRSHGIGDADQRSRRRPAR